MYAVDGGRDLPERTLDHLAGYAQSTPVRTGNGAVDQRQSDVLGEVMAALHRARTLGLEDEHDGWALQRTLVEDLAEHWDQPDNGIWEIRGPLRHFTHSRVHGLGGLRPGGPRRRGVRPGRTGRGVAGAARPGPRGDPRARR